MFKKIWLIFGLLAIIGGLFTYYQIQSNLDQMEIDMNNVIIREPSVPPRPTPQVTVNEEEVEDEPEHFYCLIVGIDLREQQWMLNTDSIMVAHVIPENHIVKLVSLPRDTRIQNRQERYVKINSVFSSGYQHAVNESRKNPDLLSGRKVNFGNVQIAEEYISSGIVELRETVENFLDIDIEYSFLVNFETVISLVDAVGGIEIDVERSMHYDAEFDQTHIHLEKGLQILDGQNALNYARFRLDNRGPEYDSNDFERGLRQQKVIAALVDRIASWESLPKIFQLIDIVTANLKTDMNRTTMIDLVRKFYGNMHGDNIISLPFEGDWISPYVIISDENLETLKEQLKSLEKPSSDPEEISEPEETADE